MEKGCGVALIPKRSPTSPQPFSSERISQQSVFGLKMEPNSFPELKPSWNRFLTPRPIPPQNFLLVPLMSALHIKRWARFLSIPVEDTPWNERGCRGWGLAWNKFQPHRIRDQRNFDTFEEVGGRGL
ncbi:hypothetical protein AVEN_34953-1 [Araneus ventricosus]|uniref:Uncharacterized protein n=1 Tax=Araneus ventricosus TaxID=182803 RepID=A0A4Y2VKE1_ARAVE|nr:hypothetical protein AVEN_34953-1 [Araneus ventricosus]